MRGVRVVLIAILVLSNFLITNKAQAFYLREKHNYKVFSKRGSVKSSVSNTADCGPQPISDPGSQEYLDYTNCIAGFAQNPPTVLPPEDPVVQPVANPAPPPTVLPIGLPITFPPVVPVIVPTPLPVVAVDHCAAINAAMIPVKNANNALLNDLTALQISFSEIMQKMTDFLSQVAPLNAAVQRAFAAMQQTSVCTAPGYSPSDWLDHNPEEAFDGMKTAASNASNILAEINMELSKARDSQAQLDAMVCTEDNYQTISAELSAISGNVTAQSLNQMDIQQKISDLKSGFMSHLSDFKARVSSFLSSVNNIVASHSPINIPTIMNECNPGISPTSKRKKFAVIQVPLRKKVVRLIDRVNDLFNQLPASPDF